MNAKKKNNLVYIAVQGHQQNDVVGRKIIETLEKYGGINKHEYLGDSGNCAYYISPKKKYIEVCTFNSRLWEVLSEMYTPINIEDEVMVEVTMEEVAKKFGINVKQLRIKK